MSTFTFRGHEVFYRREGAGAPMVFSTTAAPRIEPGSR
jgi:hypothetical protein